MSARDLVEAECGAANPLVRLASHYTRDREHLRHGRAEFGVPGATFAANKSSDRAFVQEFLSETRSSLQRPPPQTFRMDSLPREMRRKVEHMGPKMAPNAEDLAVRYDVGSSVRKSDSWASDFLLTDTSKVSVHGGRDWSSEFLKENPSLNRPDNPVGDLFTTHNYDNKWAEEYLDVEPPLLKRVVSEDEELAKIANQILDATKHKDLFSDSTFFHFLGEVGSGDSLLIGGNFIRTGASAGIKEFNALHKFSAGRVPPTPAQSRVDESADLTAQQEPKASTRDGGSSSSTSSSTYIEDFWQNPDEEEWQQNPASAEEEHPRLSEFAATGLQPCQNYGFGDDENPLKDHPDALEEGKIKLAQGDIPSAVLLFEAAVQQNPESGETWALLGMTRAKNEQDPAAISALRRAVVLESEADPKNALMALAVSCTNESYRAQACRSLQEWIRNHASYSHLSGKSSATIRDFTSSSMSTELHSETIDMSLGAARLAGSAEIDVDVQCGLGILFNLSGDYDKAVDCFRAALQVRPGDALMWNKLGATLANGNRSEEAVNAYHSALQNAPGFIRCRYNLGISCISLKAYTEAAQHFLTALNFQAAGRGPQGETSKSVMSESIWASLRLTVSLMDRKDLYSALDYENLEALSMELGLKQS